MPGKTRPVVQTGSYGANVGQVKLTVDAATGEVTAYTARNVARTATDDATLVTTYPRAAAVKPIVDAAIAASAVVGNQPVADISANITTAYTLGSYVDGVYVGPVPADLSAGRDDRMSESALGNYVANALRDSLADPVRGGAEIGFVNPGGLRSELFQPSQDGGITPDGVVTYGEANAVLPFVNNLWTLTLTGAQIKGVLENQWQPAGTSRPYLHLGVSDNVAVTQDPTKAVGERITSISVGGVPIDPAAEYHVGTFSFLAQGGDNFTTFTQGTRVEDSGLIDRDAWIAYLTASSPVAPQFARRQVSESGMPTTVAAGQTATFTLSSLNLTSLGSPANTSVTATLAPTSGRGTSTALGEFAVTGGSASVTVTLPKVIPAGYALTLVAAPSGTTVKIPAAAGDVRAAAVVSGGQVGRIVRGVGGRIRVKVTSDLVATGIVLIRHNDRTIGRGKLVNGTVQVSLDRWGLPAGRQRVTLKYLGSADVAPAKSVLWVRVLGRR